MIKKWANICGKKSLCVRLLWMPPKVYRPLYFEITRLYWRTIFHYFGLVCIPIIITLFALPTRPQQWRPSRPRRPLSLRFKHEGQPTWHRPSTVCQRPWPHAAIWRSWYRCLLWFGKILHGCHWLGQACPMGNFEAGAPLRCQEREDSNNDIGGAEKLGTNNTIDL